MSKNYMPEVAKMLGVEIVDYVGCKTKNLLYGLLAGEYTLQKSPWRPKDGEGYYYIRSTDGFLSRSTFHNVDADDLALLNMGNCFPTKEAAEAAVHEMLEKFEEIKKGVRE